MTAHVRPGLRAERALRRRLEQRIDEMIRLLDEIDGDVDLEDGGDAEPFLATTYFEDRSSGTEWLHGRRCRVDTSDREDESEHDEDGHDAEEDRADYEPSLGWTFAETREQIFYADWRNGANEDNELDDSDYEPDSDLEPEEDCGIEDMPHDDCFDREPSLGWSTFGGQHGVGSNVPGPEKPGLSAQTIPANGIVEYDPRPITHGRHSRG